MRQQGNTIIGSSQSRCIQMSIAEMGGKTQEAYDPQGILGNTLMRIANEANLAGQTVLKPTNKIMKCTEPVNTQRIHGKVPALHITLPVRTETHEGMPAIGLDIFPQGGDFEMDSLPDHCDGSMLDSGRHCPETSLLAAPDNLFGKVHTGKIQITDRYVPQRIAHRTAHHPDLISIAPERQHKALELLIMQKGLLEKLLVRLVAGQNLLRYRGVRLDNPAGNQPTIFKPGRLINTAG